MPVMDALIAASSRETQSSIASVVRSGGRFSVTFASTGGAVRRAAAERPFDLFVINSGLIDEEGYEAAEHVAEISDGGVIFIEHAQRIDDVAPQLEDQGIVVISKPLSRASLSFAVNMIYALNVRMASVSRRNRELMHKIEDTRIINRAKIVLITALGYTEEQAHKYMEKQAMDTRTTKLAVAMDILKTYET